MTVTTPAGTSNALNFTLMSGTPTGQAPAISNLSVGTPCFSSGGANIDIAFDWTDADGDIIYVSGDFDASAKIVFTKTGCTSRSSASWLNRPRPNLREIQFHTPNDRFVLHRHLHDQYPAAGRRR